MRLAGFLSSSYVSNRSATSKHHAKLTLRVPCHFQFSREPVQRLSEHLCSSHSTSDKTASESYPTNEITVTMILCSV